MTTASNTTGIINPAPLTVTASTNTKTYDSTLAASAKPSVAGLFGADAVTGIAEVYSDRNAGSSKTLSISTFLVHDGNGGNNYTVATVNDTTGVISRAALTVTAKTNSKTYDGSITAGAIPTVSGLVGGDTATGLIEAYANPNAGSAKTLAVISYTVADGNGGNNYSVTKVADTTGIVSAAPLTITAGPNTKVYDATKSAAALPTVAGLKGSDTVSGLAEAYSNGNAGSSKTLSVSAYTVADGNGGNNYAVTTVANTAGLISQAALTITATANTKTYDSTTSAAAVPTVSGLLGTDSVTGLAEAYASLSAGSSKTLSISAYTIGDGNGGNNYAVTTTNSTAGQINQATLTITARTNTKSFDGTTTAAATPTVSGLVGSDTVTGLSESYNNPNQGTGKTLNVNPGYTVNDGNGGTNYAVTTAVDGTGSITAGSIATTATLQSGQASVTYGTPVVFTVTITAAAGVFAPSGTVTVFDNSSHNLGNATFQSSSGLISTWTLTTGVKTLNVTSPLVHNITATYSGTNFQSNSATLAGGETVLPKALTITATTNTKTYNSTTSAAAKPTVSGLVGSDTVTGLAELYSDRNVGSSKTLSVSAYTVNDSDGGSNYSVTKVTTTTGVITQAALTITAAANTRTYDSTTTAAALPTVSGLAGNDTVVGLAELYSDRVVGSGKTLSVSAYSVSDGNGGNNYTVTTLNSTAGTINKAALTITAATNTKNYDGTASAAAVPVVTGLLGADTVTGRIEAYSDKNAGSGKTLGVTAYTINDGSAGSNYAVNTVANTTGVVNKASLTITASTNTKTYDATTSAGAQATATGLIGGDTVTGLSEAYDNKNAGSAKNLSIASYTINDGNSGNNYAVTLHSSSTGLINKAALKINAVTNTKIFDGTTSAAATPVLSGLQGADTVTGMAEAYADPNIGTAKTLSVSAYTINDNNSGHNYSVSTSTITTGVVLAPLTDVSIVSTLESALAPPKGSTATYSFMLHLAKPLTQAVTVNYSTVNGTGASGARAGTDFKGSSNTTITVPAGSTNVPINVTLLGGTPQLPGGPADKFFTVQLNWAVSSGNKQQNITTSSATADIRQVFAPTISIAPSQTVHLAGNTYAVSFQVLGGYPSLAYAQADGPVSVSFSTSNGTAKAGTNYKGTSGSMTLPASALLSGSTTITIPITAIGAAAGQYFNVTLGSVNNATLVPGSTKSQVFIYNPQVAAGTPGNTAGGVVLSSTSQLTSLIQAAEANWVAAGVKSSSFSNVQFQIGNIGNGVLANTAGKVITIDAGAAGFGWYTDPGLGAFQRIANSDAFFARMGSAAAGHMDLLTVIEHELGHILGLDDVDGTNNLMATALAAGVRRLP